MAKPARRVFVSYTAQDLSAHADVVVAVLRKLGLVAIDHRDSGATGQPSVSWCLEQVESSDILIVLLAHRYGWIPTMQEGGDDHKSITWLEVRRARDSRKIVLPYLVDARASWPPEMIEGLRKPKVLPRIRAFRKELEQSVVKFFTDDPTSLDGPVSRDVSREIEGIRDPGDVILGAWEHYCLSNGPEPNYICRVVVSKSDYGYTMSIVEQRGPPYVQPSIALWDVNCNGTVWTFKSDWGNGEIALFVLKMTNNDRFDGNSSVQEEEVQLDRFVRVLSNTK